MSKIFFNSINSTSNCGMDELNGFPQLDRGVRVSGKEWLEGIVEVTRDEGNTELPAVVLFSGNEIQDRYAGSPQHFARWLKSRKEPVVETEYVLNMNSSLKIKAYLWVPSDKIRAEFNKIFEYIYEEPRAA